jgi:1-acyl-sn-glycerol-3-phosphate acyltransferase
VGTAKGDLPLNDRAGDRGRGTRTTSVHSPLTRAVHAARSLAFILICALHLVLIVEPLNWLVIAPVVTLFPSRRSQVIRFWVRTHAGYALWLAGAVAGVRRETSGGLPAESCVAVMNHQSLFDIPLALLLVRGPYPLIPCRASYSRGIPGISFLIRWMRCPLVFRGRSASRAEVLGLRDAAEEVARGDHSMVIYPEGHRSRDGQLLPFMRVGLKLVLAAARARPVYAIVADGLSHLRTLPDTLRGLTGSTLRIRVLGPYPVPADDAGLDAFMDRMRDDMIKALKELRGERAAAQEAPDVVRA